MRAFLVVLDSVGCGNAPDAAAYGDSGANTLGHILEARPRLRIPVLRTLGLEHCLALSAGGAAPDGETRASFGVMRERSAGKDTTTGHWEIAGVVLDKPFPVFERFPEEFVRRIEKEAGIRLIGNLAASGTTILEELGESHLQTGAPILYTSADSVLQIAAHEEVVPVERLYAICEIARKHADTLQIGRVIARPFEGSPGAFRRTAGRHDFSYPPPRTVLNALGEAGVPVIGIGKISDIFAGSGMGESRPTGSNAEGMRELDGCLEGIEKGLVFANLVDFDMLYGHRRDVEGYARALEEFDAWLGEFLGRLRGGDLLLITADHGNDPTHPGTDHTREQVPLLMVGDGPPRNLGIRETYADVAASLAVWFGLEGGWPVGRSFLSGEAARKQMPCAE